MLYILPLLLYNYIYAQIREICIAVLGERAFDMKKKRDVINLIIKNRSVLYSVLVALCGAGLCFSDMFIGLVLIIISVGMIVYSIVERIAVKHSSEEFYSKMTAEAGKENFDITRGITLPMVSVGTDGKINWWNDAFSKICPSVVMHDGITELIPSITVEMLSRRDEGEEKILFNERRYAVTSVPFKAESAADSAFVITLRDVTDYEKAKETAENSRTVIAHILIDNYDETLGDADSDISYQAEKEIDALIFDWAHLLGGSARHLDKEKYICIFNAKMLEAIKEMKFDILDRVKAVSSQMPVQPTLSIGVGIDGSDINEIDAFAKAALDMALGRGGDQAVIKDGQSFSYYGGKNRETEKRTKVKARVKAQALVRLMEQSGNVLIMGHSYADADAMGACAALACAAMAKGRTAKVIMESYDTTVRAIMKDFEHNQTHWGLFVNRAQAREYMNDKTLVIVCDTHRRSLAAAPEILDAAKTLVLIDHHRRSEDFILNTDLLYHEPFASSSCEMVSEMLQYMGRSGIDSEIAEAMYAGMVVDTNNFVFKTGVRTFEAAAYLKRLGADPMRVKRFFRESMTSYTERAQIVSDAAMYKGSIAISKVYSNSVLQETVAKAANDLLEIEGVSASFVVAKLQGAVTSISGRSLGDVNIQMIMEKLGGGGHMLQGAAQLESVYVDEAETRLKAAIDEYLENR